MTLTSRTPLFRASTSAGLRGPSGAEAFWGVLDRFAQGLQTCPHSADQIALVLDTIRAGIHADAVYWYPGPGDEPVTVSGERCLAPDWCQAFARQQLTVNTQGGSLLLLPQGQGDSDDSPPGPQSVAMVRMSKTRSVWIVALNFQPGQRFREADLQLMALVRRLLLNHRRQARVQDKLKDALFGLVRCLIAAIHAKNPYTYGHSERVARMALRLGRQMGLAPAVLSDLYLAGLLHDVGKIGIRNRVLQHSGPLSAEDRAHIQEHPVIGDSIIGVIKPLTHLRPGVRNHHERYDGLGYPDRLAGEDIPLLARILAVADACDAMRSARPYRLAMPPEQVDAILVAGAGTQWDPHVVNHFLACRRDLYLIGQKGVGDSVLHAVTEVINTGDED